MKYIHEQILVGQLWNSIHLSPKYLPIFLVLCYHKHWVHTIFAMASEKSVNYYTSNVNIADDYSIKLISLLWRNTKRIRMFVASSSRKQSHLGEWQCHVEINRVASSISGSRDEAEIGTCMSRGVDRSSRNNVAHQAPTLLIIFSANYLTSIIRQVLLNFSLPVRSHITCISETDYPDTAKIFVYYWKTRN